MSRKVALITGVSAKGMVAYAVAQGFAGAGYDLVITGRNTRRLKEAAKEISRDAGVEVLPLTLEVTRGAGEADVEQLVKTAGEKFGRIDVLVNASQAAKVGDTLQKCRMQDLQLALDSGVTAAFLLMRACYPFLRESKGCVINTLSTGAREGAPGFAMLAASKEGLRGISSVAGSEWAEDGIAVYCVEPRVKTAAFKKWADEYAEAAAETDVPGSLEDFAAQCVQLAKS